jgi:hypothetical protein
VDDEARANEEMKGLLRVLEADVERGGYDQDVVQIKNSPDPLYPQD